MSRIRPIVSVVNESSVVDDADLARVCAALQKQCDSDFAPVWGRSATVRPAIRGSLDPKSWWLVILDNSDQAGALGYHDLTPSALPLGKIFAKTDEEYGLSWTVTASHELLEMLGDPGINLVAEASDGFYAYELCDACEADDFGYRIDGVLVSDFVHPRWFEEGVPGPYDRQHLIEEPLALLPGGYIGVWRPGRGWEIRTAELAESVAARTALPSPGSRREKRARGLAALQASTLG